MTCRGFIQLLLKVINVLFILVGVAMIGYGIYMVVTFEKSSSSNSPPPPSPPPPSLAPPSTLRPPSVPPSDEMYLLYRSLPLWDHGNKWPAIGMDVLQSRRALLQKQFQTELSSVSSFLGSLSAAWFLYSFIGLGVIITLITSSGCIAASFVNGCCLSFYAILVGLVIIIQLSVAAFIYFHDNWQDVIPDDSTGELDSIKTLIEDNFGILKWVALAIVLLQVIAMVLAIILRCIGSSARTDYDSDDEYLRARSTRKPLLNRQGATGTARTVDNSTRSDAWSTRMREKYGLDNKRDFSYKPAESRRYAQQSAVAEGSKSKCRVM